MQYPLQNPITRLSTPPKSTETFAISVLLVYNFAIYRNAPQPIIRYDPQGVTLHDP